MVQKGVETPVCVVVSSGDDWGTVSIPYARWLWTPIADQMSVYDLPSSYKDLVLSSSSTAQSFQPFVSIHVESNTTLSFIRRWYDQERQMIFPYLTAIINVDKGKILGISWDDACLFCGKGTTRCSEDTFFFNGTAAEHISEPTTGCWYSKSECDKIVNTNGTLCDIKIYAVWSGTDKNGVALTSFNSRWSAFPTDQVTNTFRDYSHDLLNAGLTTLTDTVTSVQGSVSNFTNTVTGG